MMALISWIEGSALNLWILNTQWVWPVMEILHFIGLSLLLGSLLIVDLRLIGCFRKINIQAVQTLLPLAVSGFLINLVTGIVFFLGDPMRYVINVGFQLKMVLIGLAGLNTLWFIKTIRPSTTQWAPNRAPSGSARATGLISLALWFGVLLLGRLIPYVGSG